MTIQIPFVCKFSKDNPTCLYTSIGTGAGALLILLTCLICCCFRRRNKFRKMKKQLYALEIENEKGYSPDTPKRSRKKNLSFFNNNRSIMKIDNFDNPKLEEYYQIENPYNKEYHEYPTESQYQSDYGSRQSQDYGQRHYDQGYAYNNQYQRY
eukprot:NODE_787_length_4254_cov_0.173526.p3 type:complete len:153 gc:universal NODE_787_length_4254_cov_0.173526:721-1179(+)